MSRDRFLGIFSVAAVALATGFLVAGQVRAQLLTPSNQVARYQALVRSVQDLEKTNESSRAEIATLRAEIDALERAAAQQSDTTRALQNQVADLRAHAGLTAVHGPGDVVDLLFAHCAEGVSVSGRRITPLSAFSGSAGQVVIDQGPPLAAPIKVLAVGDRNRMVAALDDPSSLPDLRDREVRFQILLTVAGMPDVKLPAYDSSLQIPHVSTS